MGMYIDEDDDVDQMLHKVFLVLQELPDHKKAKGLTTLAAMCVEVYASQKSPRAGRMLIEELTKCANKYSNFVKPSARH